MSVIHAVRGLRWAAQTAAAVAVTVVLLAYTPGPATAAAPVGASTVASTMSPAEFQAATDRLLAAIEPCSAQTPRGDIDALGRCAVDLAVPDADENSGIIHFINSFLHCLWLQVKYGVDGPYGSIRMCMWAYGYGPY